MHGLRECGLMEEKRYAMCHNAIWQHVAFAGVANEYKAD